MKASLLGVCGGRHRGIKRLVPRGGKIMFWASEVESVAGSLLPCSPEKKCTLGQAQDGRAPRGWLHCGMSLSCLFAAVSLARFELRPAFLAWFGVALWMHDLGVEPGTTAHLLPDTVHDAG